jgi:hypothetical protein
LATRAGVEHQKIVELLNQTQKNWEMSLSSRSWILNDMKVFPQFSLVTVCDNSISFWDFILNVFDSFVMSISQFDTFLSIVVWVHQEIVCKQDPNSVFR